MKTTETPLQRPPRSRDGKWAAELIEVMGRFEEIRDIDGGFAAAYADRETTRARLESMIEYFHTRHLMYAVELVQDAEATRIWVNFTGPAEAIALVRQQFEQARSERASKPLFWHRQTLGARIMRRMDRVGRRLTSSMRVLPDYLLIGAARCGTSSLATYLSTHPSIHPAARKEVYFFDHDFSKGLGYYRSFFPTRTEKRRFDRNSAIPFRTGEATPCYMFHPHVARRVAKSLPDIRLIVQLRNPVNRAYSEYFQKRHRMYESLSFEEAIDAEQGRVEGELEKMLTDEHYFSYNRWHFSYLGRGRYAEQLERWFEVFPREQILVLTSEQFFDEPAETYASIMRHLGLPPWMPELTPQKTNTAPYPEMNPETRQRLVDYFAPHNRRLYDLLGREFSWDK